MIFDRDDDLKNEDRIIERVCQMWDCEAEKLSGFAYADFILLRGKVEGIDQGVAFAEIRCRSVKKDDYDTIFISINKVMNMCKMSELTGARTSIHCRMGRSGRVYKSGAMLSL